MGTHKRTARRFQVEALEGRWAPGGVSGGVLASSLTRHIGEEIPQAQVAPLRAPGGGVTIPTHAGSHQTCQATLILTPLDLNRPPRPSCHSEHRRHGTSP